MRARQYIPIIATAAALAGNPNHAEASRRAFYTSNHYRNQAPITERIKINPRTALIFGGGFILGIIFTGIVGSYFKEGKSKKV